MVAKKTTKKAKSTKTTKSTGKKQLRISKHHARVGISILVVAWVIIAAAVYGRYQSAVKIALPKQVDATRLDALAWFDIQNDKAESAAIDGYTYIGVDATIQNVSQQPIWYAPVMQMYVKDSQGRQYGIQMVALDAPFNAGQYLPMQHASGQLGYMVPQHATDLEWCVSTQTDQSQTLCQPLVKDNKRT